MKKNKTKKKTAVSADIKDEARESSSDNRIALNILKSGCKIGTFDLFFPKKIFFLLHISRSTPEFHISLVITAWTIHIKVICYISVIWYLKLNTIVNLRDDRILKAVVSFYWIDSETAS